MVDGAPDAGSVTPPPGCAQSGWSPQDAGGVNGSPGCTEWRTEPQDTHGMDSALDVTGWLVPLDAHSVDSTPGCESGGRCPWM